MSNKHLITVSILTSLLLTVAAHGDSKASKRDSESTSQRSQPAAPVIHRRASVPAGWFNQAQPAGTLTDEQVRGARQAAHFDTTGESQAGSSTAGVSDRLLQMRRAVVYDDLSPSTPPARRMETTRVAPPTTHSNPATNRAATEGIGPGGQAVASDPPVQPLPIDQLPSIMKRPEVPSAASPPLGAAVQTESPEPVANPSRPIAAEPPTAPAAAEPVATAPIVETTPIVETPPVREVAVTPIRENPPADNPPTTTSPMVEPTPPVETSSSASNPASGDGVLITHQSPVLSVTTRGPRTIVVGKSASYVVDVTNRSEFDAKDVVIRMNIPHWVEIVQQQATLGSAHIQPDEQGDSSLTWSVGRLSARGQEKITLELIPRGSRPLDLGVTWTFSPATSTTQIVVQEPKLEMSISGANDVQYGETKVYSITVANPGSGDAENVVLSLLPLVPGEGPAGVRPLGTIAAGTRRTIEVELTARQTGQLQVRAEATADGGLQAQSQQDVLVRRAVLEAQVEGPPMKYAGTRSRYSVRIVNSGDAAAQEVVAVATLPAGAQQIACSDGASVDANHGQVQWQLGTLRPGASRTLEMECVLMSPGANRLDLRTVAAGELSAVASAVTSVESLADLKLMVNDPQGAVAVGAEVTYEVRIINRGTKAAENVLILGYFSEGIEPVAVRGWRGSMNEGEVVLERIPRLGPGQEMLVKIAAQANRPGDHVFRAELECGDPETKLAVEEWTRFYGDLEGQASLPANSTPAATPTGQDDPSVN